MGGQRSWFAQTVSNANGWLTTDCKRRCNTKMSGNARVLEMPLNEITYTPTRSVGSTLDRLDRSGGLEETVESVKKIGCFWKDFANTGNLDVLLPELGRRLRGQAMSAPELMQRN